MPRPVKFREIQPDQPFTPYEGVGVGFYYVKKVNGVCPKVGTEEEGIFYPNDLVYLGRVPYNILKPHLESR